MPINPAAQEVAVALWDVLYHQRLEQGRTCYEFRIPLPAPATAAEVEAAFRADNGTTDGQDFAAVIGGLLGTRHTPSIRAESYGGAYTLAVFLFGSNVIQEGG